MSDKPTHVLIDRESLEALVAAADAAVEDLTAGLADGTYHEDAIGGYPSADVGVAIVIAHGVLA